MEQKRGPGRPRKAEQFDGPVVLTLNKKRERLEIELTTSTRGELDEYLSWVEECEPELTPGEVWFTTFEYAITTLLRSDKKWRQRQRKARAQTHAALTGPAVGAAQPIPDEIRPDTLSSSTEKPAGYEPVSSSKPAPTPVPSGARPGPSAPSLPLPGSRGQKTTV
jgi:hypothetical protein